MKCIVKDCVNQAHEGQFIGDLCNPCHEFVTTGSGIYSQVYRNTQRTWVSLTDEEVKHEWVVWKASFPRYVGFAKGIEAKLRSKNQ